MRDSWRRVWVAGMMLACGGVAILAPADWRGNMGSQARAGEPTIKPNPNAEAQAKQAEYAVFNKHCTQCHVSVADPERPGKTRDEWYATINLMEGHGLGISQEDADMIVDLLFNLRRGVEDTPG